MINSCVLLPYTNPNTMKIIKHIIIIDNIHELKIILPFLDIFALNLGALNTKYKMPNNIMLKQVIICAKFDVDQTYICLPTSPV